MNKNNKIYKFLRFFYRLIKKIFNNIKISFSYFRKYDLIEKEHLKHFGSKYPDKIFYVIRRKPPGAGLLSNFHWVMNHVIYAIEKGYIPVVNMENYKTYFNENCPIETSNGKTINAWEYYFEQPCGYSISDIKKSKNVILSDLNKYSIVKPLELYNDNKTIMQKYNNIITNYLKFNKNIIKHFIEAKDNLFKNKNNILGVLYRGTDMKTAQLHYTPPSLEETTKKTLQIFNDENFSYIFIRTEEQEAIDSFYKVFDKNIIILSNINRFQNYNTGEIADLNQKNSISAYNEGLDYLTEIYFLSQCDGIIASKVNGTNLALGLNNNKYRYIHIFDLGINN